MHEKTAGRSLSKTGWESLRMLLSRILLIMTQTWSWQKAQEHSLTIVDGFRVGHATDEQNLTGCTAIVCDQDAVAGVDVRGGATASHEIELLDPCGLVELVQGVMLTGGSAMGLGCVQGAIEYFRSNNRGFQTQQGVVPIVPAAAIYDLGIGSADTYPTSDHGLAACQAAAIDFDRGSVGAGAGAAVGKIHGHDHAMRGGIGTAGWESPDGLRVGALVVVNAFGDVLNPESGRIIAGARAPGDVPLSTANELIAGNLPTIQFGSNTTLCVLTTNAKLTKTQACIVARIAQSGISRSVSPCHTQFDGDMVFALSIGDHPSDVNRVGVLGSRVIEAAVMDAVLKASSADGVPSAGDLGWFKSGVHE